MCQFFFTLLLNTLVLELWFHMHLYSYCHCSYPCQLDSRKTPAKPRLSGALQSWSTAAPPPWVLTSKRGLHCTRSSGQFYPLEDLIINLLLVPLRHARWTPTPVDSLCRPSTEQNPTRTIRWGRDSWSETKTIMSLQWRDMSITVSQITCNAICFNSMFRLTPRKLQICTLLLREIHQ